MVFCKTLLSLTQPCFLCSGLPANGREVHLACCSASKLISFKLQLFPGKVTQHIPLTLHIAVLKAACMKSCRRRCGRVVSVLALEVLKVKNRDVPIF